MPTQPLSDKSSNLLNRMLQRLMRRQGVAVDKIPDFAGWTNFVVVSRFIRHGLK